MGLNVKSERLRELELEYELARLGLRKSLTGALLAASYGLMSLLALAVVLVMTGVQLFGGNQLVAIFGILALAVIIYFVIVFGRTARIQAEIGKEKQRLEVEIGKKVR